MNFLLPLLQPLPVNEPPFTFSDGITLFWHTVRDFMKRTIQRLPYIIVGAVAFLLFWLLAKGVRKVINKVAVQSHSIDDRLANLISRIVGTLITITGFLTTCVVIFPSFKPGNRRLVYCYPKAAWHEGHQSLECPEASY